MTQPPDAPDARRSPHPNGDDPLPEIIPRVLDGALRSAGLDISDPKISRAVEVTMMVASGPLPLPPPDILEAYETRFPGLVDRFIGWTEEQRQHRFAIETERTRREENRLDRAQIFTASIAVCGLVGATVVGIYGSVIVASIIAIVSIGGPTAAVYLARHHGSDPTTAPAEEKPPSD
jgi:uncharacterized membrane protein